MQAEATFLAYMPVYHRGWENFFERYPEVKELVLLSAADVNEFGPTHKDIYGVEPTVIKKILLNLGRLQTVTIMDTELLKKWQKMPPPKIVMADDEAVGGWVKQNLGSKVNVIKDNAFVRWTREKALGVSAVKAGRAISKDEIKAKIEKLMARAKVEGEKSSDWWRQVGCCLCLASGEVIVTHNTHLPEPETPNICGDVRAQFHRGDHFELTTAIHAEAAAVARAARQGKSTQGAEMVVTDFPCPVCAKLVAAAGIKRVYYCREYAMLDAEEILCAFGVELVRVD